jgi:hypothetical protein
MYDGGKIITGLVIGVGLLLFPVLLQCGQSIEGAGAGADRKGQGGATVCGGHILHEKEHMKLLDEWRHSVVRDDRTATTRAAPAKSTTQAFRPPAWTAIPTKASSATSVTTTWA